MVKVTGSMSQHGEVQAVGSVNAKIEGWFDVCLARGLTGTQGAIIPSHNVKELMLSDRIVRAVKENKFKVYGIDHVDEAFEILSGIKAGERSKTEFGMDGSFEEGTFNYLVDQKLMHFSLLESERNQENSIIKT